jgi:flagellar hook-basal body complex protein FliE
MAIESIATKIPQVKSIQAYEQALSQKSGQGNKGQSFADVFGGALKEVDALQKDADVKIEGMITGKGVQTHDAMIALEKADVAFKLMNNIRGRIVRAYEEIIRMQA